MASEAKLLPCPCHAYMCGGSYDFAHLLVTGHHPHCPEVRDLARRETSDTLMGALVREVERLRERERRLAGALAEVDRILDKHECEGEDWDNWGQCAVCRLGGVLTREQPHAADCWLKAALRVIRAALAGSPPAGEGRD